MSKNTPAYLSRAQLLHRIDEAVATHTLTHSDLTQLLATEDPAVTRHLYAAAQTVRARHHGDGVHLRALIEFSNYCSRNCLYCGLRRDNPHIQRLQMEPAAIIQTAQAASQAGFRTIVLQSGQWEALPAAALSEVIRAIKRFHPTDPPAVTLSVGERSPEEYAEWRAAGADRFLLKQETSCPDLYAQLHPDMAYHRRIAAAHTLKELGYELGSGSMLGIPGVTSEKVASDLLFFQRLGVAMLGIGPFIPHPDTPLGTSRPPSLHPVRTTVALARLLMPQVHLPATTASETLFPGARRLLLESGANVVMVNVTPTAHRAAYTLYPGRQTTPNHRNDDRQPQEEVSSWQR